MFFGCDGVLGEVWRCILLLLQCCYAVDLTILVRGMSAEFWSGMWGTVWPLDVGPCRGGYVALAGVPFHGVGVTLPARAAWRCPCYSVEHLHLARVPLVPILDAVMQQGSRGATWGHGCGWEDNLALCAPLAFACVDECSYSLTLAHVVACHRRRVQHLDSSSKGM